MIGESETGLLTKSGPIVTQIYDFGASDQCGRFTAEVSSVDAIAAMERGSLTTRHW